MSFATTMLYKVHTETLTQKVYRVWCTACGSYHDLDKDIAFWNVCPDCGAIPEAKGFQEYFIDGSYKRGINCIVFENTNLPNNDLLIRHFRIIYDVEDAFGISGGIVKKSIIELERIFLGNKIQAYLNGEKTNLINFEYEIFKSLSNNPYRQAVFKMFQSNNEIAEIISNSCMSRFGIAEAWGFVDGYEQIVKFPSFSYINSLYKNHSMATLVKSKLFRIAKDMLFHSKELNTGNMPEQVLGVSSDVVDLAVKHNMSKVKLDAFNSLYIVDNALTYEDFLRLVEDDLSFTKVLSLLTDYNLTVRNILEYLDTVYANQYIHKKEALRIWLEYLKLAKSQKMNLKDSTILFPDLLKKAYDMIVFKHTNPNESVAQKLAEIAIRKQEQYEFANGQYIIRIPRTIEELSNAIGYKVKWDTDIVKQILNEDKVVVAIMKKDNDNKVCAVVTLFKGTDGNVYFDSQQVFDEGFIKNSVANFIKYWKTIFELE